MFVGVILAAFETLAHEAFFPRQAREPVQQFVGVAVGLLCQQPAHQVRHGQCIAAAVEHLFDRARRLRGFAAFLGFVRLGEPRRFWLEARQRIHVRFHLAGAAQKGALRAGEHRHRRLWHGVQPFTADRGQCQRRAAGHGIVAAGFFAQRQQQLARMAQGELSAGLHFEDPRVGTQQHVVVDQVAEALLFAEHAQQHVFNLAHTLLEGAVGVNQLNHRLDVFIPRRQHFGIPLAQRDLPVAGLGALCHGHQRLLIIGQFFQHIAHAHVQQTQLTRQIVAVADVERILDIPRQTLKVAQVGFDFQAQAEAVFAPQIGQEVMDLRIQLEAVRAFGDRHQNVEPDPAVEHVGDVLRGAVQLMRRQLQAQFAEAQRALVEVFAQGLKECPVLGEGT